MKLGSLTGKGDELIKRVRAEYDNYVVKVKDGKEIELATDRMIQKMGQIKKGEGIVVKVNHQNRALSILCCVSARYE